MSGKFLARALAMSLALVLGACGGGDGGSSLSGQDGSGGGTGGEATVDVGSIQISASPVILGTSPSAVSDIRVFVKDSNNRVMTGVSVDFRVDSDAILQVVRDVTDESGTAVASLSTSTNPANRTVTVTATAGDESASMPINISGSTLEIEGPSTVSFGTQASYTAKLLDSNGGGIPNQAVEVSTGSALNIVSMGTVRTGDTGEVSFAVKGGTPGADTISVSAFADEGALSASQGFTVSNDNFQFTEPTSATEVPLGTNADVVVKWEDNGNPVSGGDVTFYTTRGQLADPNGEATTDSGGLASMGVSSASAGPALIKATTADGKSATLDILFYSDNPSKLTARADRSQLKAGDQTVIQAVLRDPENNLVKNRDIVFNIKQDVSGGTLLSAVDRTDSLGRASVVYVAGAGSGTARDGVIISATEKASIGTAAPIRDEATLTVSDGALRITLGTGNEIEEPDPDHYSKDWVVYVTNANGEPVENARVELAALPYRYHKGEWEQAYCGTDECWKEDVSKTCPAEDINLNGFLEDSEDLNCNGLLDTGEDINGNGTLELGEDINGNCKLDPSNDAVVITENLESSREGAVHFKMTYPQSNCNWTEMRIEARASVDGTEFSETVNAKLSCASSDLDDWSISPPGINGGSKYGKSNSCQDYD